MDDIGTVKAATHQFISTLASIPGGGIGAEDREKSPPW